MNQPTHNQTLYIPGRHNDSINIKTVRTYGHYTGLPKNCNDKIILDFLL